MNNLAGAETALTGAMGRLLAIVEAYPDLKADTHMSQLMEELSSTENKVAFARQAFNDAVMSYNNACENFPSNVVANTFSFKHSEFLDIGDEQKREVPRVAFS